MKRLILAIAVSLVAIAPFAAAVNTATAVPEQDWHGSLVFFFGECEVNSNSQTTEDIDDACRGIGLFWGDWTPETLAVGIAHEASYEMGGSWVVEKLKAYDLVHGELAVGKEYECTYTDPQMTAEQVEIGYIAFWVAYFEVVPCFTT